MGRQLTLDAGIPPGVVNVVPGLGEVAEQALVTHPDVAMIAFTGSTEVGRQILHAAADRIARVELELGGKSPQIIFPTPTSTPPPQERHSDCSKTRARTAALEAACSSTPMCTKR